MILKTFNLRSVADRMQKSGTDPGATTTCPQSVAGRDQLITHTYAQHRRVRDYQDATPLGVAFIARPHTCVYARI